VPPPGVGIPRRSMADFIEHVQDELEKNRKRVASNPFYSEDYEGVMRHYSTYSIIRHVMPQRPSEEEEFNEEDLSTFFTLSQKTGFSKARLCEIYKKWISVTRNDMTPNQFCSWMRTIGFQDRTVIARLFEALDEDCGGTLSFAEVCMGLSFIMDRDIKLPQFKVTQFDEYFYKLCHKVCDFDGRGALSRFEVYKVIASTLGTNSKETKDIVEIIWSKAVGPGRTDEIAFITFRQCLYYHRFIWRFFRKVMMMQAVDRSSAEFVRRQEEAKAILIEEDGESSESDEEAAEVRSSRGWGGGGFRGAVETEKTSEEGPTSSPPMSPASPSSLDKAKRQEESRHLAMHMKRRPSIGTGMTGADVSAVLDKLQVSSS